MRSFFQRIRCCIQVDQDGNMYACSGSQDLGLWRPLRDDKGSIIGLLVDRARLFLKAIQAPLVNDKPPSLKGERSSV